jgi:hypothetical protein
VNFLMSRGKSLNKVVIMYDRNFDINIGRAALESNVYLTF